MQAIVSDIVKLHFLMNQPMSNLPAQIRSERRELRKNLVEEETTELFHAMSCGDMVGILDAIIDSIVVLVGTAVEYGLGSCLKDAWDEVQRSNVAKLDENGKPILREDGKFLKPDGWTPPDLDRIIRQAINQSIMSLA